MLRITLLDFGKIVYTSKCNRRETVIKGVITLRRYYFCVAAICAAAVIGISGCAMNTKAESAQTQADASQPESAEAATVVEAVTGPIESMEETPNEELQPVRIYGSASHMEDGRLSIDNRSGVSAEGEIILNISQESTLILDAVSGTPLTLEDIQDGETIYAYIGPAMTMSLPPMTNAAIILPIFLRILRYLIMWRQTLSLQMQAAPRRCLRLQTAQSTFWQRTVTFSHILQEIL